MDFSFEVNLIKVPELEDMSGVEVFDLMGNARHIAGRFWMMEGDHESLIANVDLIDVGITPSHGSMDDDDFFEHSMEVFYEHAGKIKESPRWWEMLNKRY